MEPVDVVEPPKPAEEEKPKEKEPEPESKQGPPAAGESTTQLEKARHRPLGEVHLRIFSWFFTVVAQIGAVLLLFDEVESLFFRDEPSNSSSLYVSGLKISGALLSICQYCSMPLILVANFSVILRQRNSYKKLLLQHGGATLGIFLVYIFVYFRYIIPVIKKFTGVDTKAACKYADSFLALFFSYLRQLNFFVDLFICTLISFFTFYIPKYIFKGRAIICFRVMVLIPIAWSILGFIFLARNEGDNLIPGYLYPIFPLKPPLLFCVFLAIVVYLKIKEQIAFHKKKMSVEEYDKAFFSPISVRRFSRYVCLCLLIGSLLDVIFLVIYLVTENASYQRVGFGQSALVFLVIPVVWFFDFRKGNNSFMVSLLIPVVGVVLIIILWIESIYQLVNKFID